MYLSISFHWSRKVNLPLDTLPRRKIIIDFVVRVYLTLFGQVISVVHSFAVHVILCLIPIRNLNDSDAQHVSPEGSQLIRSSFGSSRRAESGGANQIAHDRVCSSALILSEGAKDSSP